MARAAWDRGEEGVVDVDPGGDKGCTGDSEVQLSPSFSTWHDDSETTPETQ